MVQNLFDKAGKRYGNAPTHGKEFPEGPFSSLSGEEWDRGRSIEQSSVHSYRMKEEENSQSVSPGSLPLHLVFLIDRQVSKVRKTFGLVKDGVPLYNQESFPSLSFSPFRSYGSQRKSTPWSSFLFLAGWPRLSSSLIENLYGFVRLYYFLFQ